MLVLENIKKLGFYPETVLDVGANKGYWSRHCHSVFPKAEFFLIEPQTEMEDSLKEFCQQTDSSYFIYAAGENNHTGKLRIWEDMQGSSFLHDKIPPKKPDGREQRIVQVTTIDSLIEENKIKKPDLVKMDIQGFELKALKGFSQAKDSHIIILEVSFFEFLEGQPLFIEVMNYMDSIGFAVYDIFNFIKRPYDKALGQCDVCFVRKDSFLKSVNAWNENQI